VSTSEAVASTLSGVCRLTADELRDPSAAVRRFALSSLAASLRVAISKLRIERIGRIPQLILAGRAAPVPLSLSHHGSYAGFACHDPRVESVDWISERYVPSKSASLNPSSTFGVRCATAADRLHILPGGFR
jgi:hypothetical protein